MKLFSTLVLFFVLFINFNNSSAQCWKMVHTGANHCIGIKLDGTLWTWGANNNGQLGNGTTTDVWSPMKIGTDTNWSKVSTGKSSNHNLAIKSDGTLWAWGYNFYGQCGNNSGTDIHAPIQIGTATDWKEVTCGMFFSLAIKNDGSLWGWGTNAFGQLNDANTNNAKLIPTLMSSGNWAQIAAGDAHTMAITNTGDLFTCGSNTYGQIGNGTTVHQYSLTQIGSGNTFISIAGGNGHSLAVQSNNTLWAWGENADGQLGLGNTTYSNSPVQVDTATNWLKVSSGEFFSFGIKTDGTRWAWGENAYGELGIGNSVQQLVPVQVGSNTNWTSAQGGRQHHASVDNAGYLYTSGRNTYGALGNGTNVHSNTLINLPCSPLQISTALLSQSELIVFPNPATQTIYWTHAMNSPTFRTSIYNLLGALQYTTDEPITSFDLSRLTSGKYLLVITNEKYTLKSMFSKRQ
jgi:alpha-tubulin suppressor-like RCC1 family protein